MDFNNDGIIGQDKTTIESIGDVELQLDGDGMGWAKLSDGSLHDITLHGQRVGNNSFSGWSLVAAETINDQNKVIWQNESGLISEWNLDSNWNWTQWQSHSVGSTAFNNIESSFNMDFNNDGII